MTNLDDLRRIPPELRERPQWVLWRLGRRNGEPTKIPCQADGRPAATNDPATWTTYEAAIRASEKPAFEGIGFVFSKDDPFTGVDFDGCLEGGELAEWAAAKIDRFAGGYMEISPSGTGVKVWVRGELPGKGAKRTLESKHTGVEMYDRGRFFAVTGDVFGDVPPRIANRQKDVDELYRWVKERPPKQPAATPAPTPIPPPASTATGRPSVEERARLYARKVPPAISGRDGSKQTMWACGVVAVGFDLPSEVAYRVLADEWNPRCEPPWAEDDLRRKISEAEKTAEKPRGWMLAEPDSIACGSRPSRNGASGRGGAGPPAPGPQDAGPADARPMIVISPRESEVVEETVAALARDPNLYVMAGNLVTITDEGKTPRDVDDRDVPAPQIQNLEAISVRERITAAADLVRPKQTKNGEILIHTHPPDWLGPMVHKRRRYPGVRPLIGITETPALRPDGSILDTPGYDAATLLYFRPNGVFDPVPAKPTRRDAEAAWATIRDVVADFPFKTPADEAVWLAAFLTPYARPAIPGPCPMTVFDANTAGAGKTKLGDAIAIPATGRPMARTVWPDGQNADEEVRKRLTSIALAGSRLMLIDNVDAPLGGAPLDAALTSLTWQDRKLGSMEMTPELPMRTIFFASGNNVQCRGDILRRVLLCRIECLDEKPEERTGFKHPNLLKHVKEIRGSLTAAALTILRAYLLASDKVSVDPLGSYEEWTQRVVEPVLWITGVNPLDVRKRTAAADSATTTRNALILGWAELPGGRDEEGGLTVAEALKILKTPEHQDRFTTLRGALAELSRTADLPSPRSIGMYLAKLEGKVVDGKLLRSNPDCKNTKAWRVVRVKDGQSAGTTGTTQGSPGLDFASPGVSKPLEGNGLEHEFGTTGTTSIPSRVKTLNGNCSSRNVFPDRAETSPGSPVVPAPRERFEL